MSYKKRTESAVLSKAKSRVAVMKVIATAKGVETDYGKDGEPLKAAEMQAAIDKAVALDNEYNGLLSEADDKLLERKQQEQVLREMNVQVLIGAANHFGRDADEIAQLGGKRLKDRKHPVRQPKAAK